MTEHRLWYDRPATAWTEALPLGNGRLGAMQYGRPGDELIRLNDAMGWSGSPSSEIGPWTIGAEEAQGLVHQARAAALAGDHARAIRSSQRTQNRYVQSFLPLADLRLLISGADGDVADY